MAQPGHLALGKWNLGKCIVWELKASSLYSFLAVMLCIIRNITLMTVLPIELYCWKAFLSVLHSLQNLSHILNHWSFTSGWSLVGWEDSTFSRQLTPQVNHLGWQCCHAKLCDARWDYGSPGMSGCFGIAISLQESAFFEEWSSGASQCQNFSLWLPGLVQAEEPAHRVPWVSCWGWWVNDFALVFVGSPVEAALLWRCKAEAHNIILMLGSISCSGFISWWRLKKKLFRCHRAALADSCLGTLLCYWPVTALPLVTQCFFPSLGL